MSELLRPRNFIAVGVIGAVAIFGGGELADYYGHRAGEAARDEIEEIDIAQEQWNELRQILADEDLRQVIVQELEADGVTGVSDVVEALADG